MTERSFDTPVEGGLTARLRTLELRLLTPDKLLILTNAPTTDADFDTSALPKVFDSFRVKA